MLHLFALTTLAVAQPVYDLLSRTPQFFAARHIDGPGLISLATLLLLLPAVLLALPVALADRLGGRSAGRIATAVAIGAMAGIVALLAIKRAPDVPAVAAIALAILAAASAGALYHRFTALHRFLELLAILALAAPILFVVRSSPHRASRPAAIELPDVEAPAVPVVLLIFDELPVASLIDGQGALDEALFPNFAALAGTSVWYRNATAVASLTHDALPPILTGSYPRSTQPATAEHHPRSLFTLLGASHQIIAAEPRSALCPPQLCQRERRSELRTLLVDLAIVYLHLLLPEELAGSLPRIGTVWGHFLDLEDKAGDFRRLVHRIHIPARPPLVVLHSVLPHHPWIYTPSGRRYHPGDEMFIDGLGPGGAAGGRWVDDRWTVLQGLQRHLLQLRFTDRLLGELIERLQELDLFDPALLVVTADHGIAFQPGVHARACTRDNYAEVLGVPLLVKLPFQEQPVVDERPAEVIDVLPTIAHVLGITLDWPLDGRSLLTREPADRTARRIYNDAEHVLTLFDLDLPGRFEAARRKLDWFGRQAGGETIDLFRPGPPPTGFLGTPIDAGRVVAGELVASIDGLGRLRSGDLSGDLLPNRVSGRLHGPPEGRHQIALALDGVLRATTWTRPEPERAGHFSFLLPTDVLEGGVQDVRLFRFETPAQLETVALDEPPALRLERRGRRPVAIRDSRGRRWEISRGAFEGEVFDAVIRERAYRIDFIGWARRTGDGSPPSSVAMFVDGSLRHAGAPNLTDPRLRDRYHLPGREDAAFVFTLPNDDLEGDITFFALSSDGTASQLDYTRLMQPEELPQRR